MILFCGFILAMAATPEETVRAALEQDPAVAAAEARVERALGTLTGTGFFLENPSIEVGIGVVGSRLEVSGTQTLALGGEGVHAHRAARAEVEAARLGLDRVRMEAAAAARQLWIRVVVADGILELCLADLESAGRLREIAAARLAAGEGATLDLSLARFEEAAAVALWLDAESEARAARADFAARTGLGSAERVAGDPLEAAPWTEVGEGRPRSDVAAAEAHVEAARRSVAAARAGRVPDLTLGGFYEREEGRTVAGPTVGIEVPLWRHNEATVGEANATLIEAEAAAAATRARADAEAVVLEAQRAPTARALQLLADMQHDALGATLGEVEHAYAAGELGLADVLLLRGRLRDGQRAWLEVRAAVARSRVEVALAMEAEELLVSARQKRAAEGAWVR